MAQLSSKTFIRTQNQATVQKYQTKQQHPISILEYIHRDISNHSKDFPPKILTFSRFAKSKN